MIAAESVRLKGQEAKLKDFCNQTGRRSDTFRTQKLGFDRSVSSRAVWKDRKEYTAFAKAVSLNMDGLPNSVDKYRKIKYNDKEEYRRMQNYFYMVKEGEVSPLMGYTTYKNVSLEVENELIGVTTSNGITVTGYSAHFVGRVIGRSATNTHYNRAGVEINEIKNALQNGTIKKTQTGKNGQVSVLFKKDKCGVAINPDTGVLIQTNSLGGKTKC